MAEESTDKEYRRYCDEIDLYEKEARQWVERGKKILRLYKDSDNERGSKKRFNILWSNVQTLKPALYARDPQPQAERRFKDSDPVGRVASEVLERCIDYTIDCHGFGQAMRQIVDDRLLPGRGVMWVRYQATMDEADSEAPEDSEQITEDSVASLAYEQVLPDYVYWEDFGHNVARTWEEVTLVWRKVYMTRAKLVKRFGEAGETVPLDHTPKGLKDEKAGEDVKKACVYELWDRDNGKVVFLSKSHPKVIESDDDPLQLTGMFPCPRPLFATLTNDSLIPVPDYALYQTQAQEIENLTARINSLQKALKVAGVYDTSAPELARLLNDGLENKLLPVDKWAAFAEKGGLKGAVDFLPVSDIASVLISLYDARERAKADLYEITGIADIIRGNSDPGETATAQQIKGRFAVLRISEAQSDVQRFARDAVRIIGEIIAEHFTLETIQAISGIRLLTAAEKQMASIAMQRAQMIAQQTGQPPQNPLTQEQAELMSQPTWDEVYELLQHQVLREFRIDIETDSTIRTDEDMDRQARTEMLSAAGTYVQSIIEAKQMAPELVPLMSEILMFGLRGHRASRALEPYFEDAIKQMQRPKEPQPDPEIIKIEKQGEIDARLREIDKQADIQTSVAEQQAQAQQAALELKQRENEAERTHLREIELARINRDLQIQVAREKEQAATARAIQVEQMKIEASERLERIRSDSRVQEAAVMGANGADV